MINLFAYFDYRKFLSDFLAEKQEGQPSLSSRNLALQAEIDPSYFAKVVKGVGNLKPEQSLRIAAALRFTAVQAEYFEILVRFNQARGHDAKRLYFERLLEYNKSPDAALLTKEQYRYYSQWYHVVIREVLNFHPGPVDYPLIAKKLIPPIAAEKVREAIALLENLKMIRPTSDARWELCDTFVTAGPELQSMAIRNFQLSMMEMAKSALEKVPKEKREISALTLSLSEDGFKEAMAEIALSKKRLQQIAHNDGNVNAVYQFNFQAFPVTDTFPGNEDEDS